MCLNIHTEGITQRLIVTQIVAKSPHFTQPNISLSRPQKPATGPLPNQLTRDVTLALYYFKINFIPCSHSQLGLPNGLFSSDFRTKILCAVFITGLLQLNHNRSVFALHITRPSRIRCGSFLESITECVVNISARTPAMTIEVFCSFSSRLRGNLDILPQLFHARFLPIPLQFITYQSSCH